MPNNALKTIIAELEELSGSQLKRVGEFIESLNTPLSEKLNPNSEFMTGEFLDEFRSRLLTQHAFQKSPLFQDTFELAFIASSEAAGKKVEKAPDGTRFWDVAVNRKKISLKSTKEKALQEHKLKISKLTEAAWIQDCRTASKRREETFSLFKEYCDNVSSIIQLRYFTARTRYELVEIPVELFQPIFDLPVGEFKTDGPSINIPIGKEPPDFTLKLDRSDAKVTLNNIRKDVCIVHADWEFMY